HAAHSGGLGDAVERLGTDDVEPMQVDHHSPSPSSSSGSFSALAISPIASMTANTPYAFTSAARQAYSWSVMVFPLLWWNGRRGGLARAVCWGRRAADTSGCGGRGRRQSVGGVYVCAPGFHSAVMTVVVISPAGTIRHVVSHAI